MNTQLKSVVSCSPAETAEDLYQVFRSEYGNYKPIDTVVRVVCAYHRGELDDLDFVMSKMSFMYHTEDAAKAIARRADKKDPDYSKKLAKADLISQITSNLEGCLK